MEFYRVFNRSKPVAQESAARSGAEYLSFKINNPHPSSILSPRLVRALDFLRALSALYVIVHHLSIHRGWIHDPRFGIFFKFGQEAVIVFFLLSGFVIFASENLRALTPKGYYIRRLRRLYPVLILSMFVSTIVLVDNGTFSKLFNWSELFGTLVGLQDIDFLKPGVIVVPYAGNTPLWSLSYEMFFYAIFPFVLKSWHQNPGATTHVIGFVCCACYILYVVAPNHWYLVLAYFLIWWSGAMAANAYLNGNVNFKQIGATLPWLAVLTMISIIAVPLVGRVNLYDYPILPVRHFAFATIALGVMCNSIGHSLIHHIGFPSRIVTYFATISYGLYIMHYPLLVQSHRADGFVGALGMAALLLLLASLGDIVLSRILPKAPTY